MKLYKYTLMVCLMSLSSCAAGPDYKRPAVDVPASYKESYGEWKVAVPQDGFDRGAWWLIYKDPILDNLEKQVEVSSQTLKAAEAAYREAAAATDEARATLFPTLTFEGTTGQQVGDMPTSGLKDSLFGAASWTPDVWGRIGRKVEGDEAEAQASAADLASVRLSMQVTLAKNYFYLRAQDELKRLLEQQVKLARKAAEIARGQYDRGIGNVGDLHAVQIQLENVQEQSASTNIRRSQLEHAIAVLIGKTPNEFSLKPKNFVDSFPAIPTGMPSTLLERRPDIASSERMVMAANAQIGLAEAAWFPNMTLSASTGYAAMSLGKLLQATNSFWAFGPSIAATIFDAGGREAREKQSIAAYDQSVANYRQVILSAFQQVEDSLSTLRNLSEQKKKLEISLSHSKELQQLALSQYEKGIGSYGDVLVAQNNRLVSEQNLLMVRTSRLAASVAFIEAIGGGWDINQLSVKR